MYNSKIHTPIRTDHVCGKMDARKRTHKTAPVVLMSDENEIFAPDTEMYEIIVTTTIVIGPNTRFSAWSEAMAFDQMCWRQVQDIKNNRRQCAHTYNQKVCVCERKSLATACRKQRKNRPKERKGEAPRWWIRMILMFSNWWTFFTGFFWRNVTKGSIR